MLIYKVVIFPLSSLIDSLSFIKKRMIKPIIENNEKNFLKISSTCNLFCNVHNALKGISDNDNINHKNTDCLNICKTLTSLTAVIKLYVPI